MHRLSFVILSLFLDPWTLQAAPLACPLDTSAPAQIAAWRSEASERLVANELSASTVSSRLASCFGPSVPVCLDRLQAYATRDVLAPPSSDPSVTPEKQAPRELAAPNGRANNYIIPENIEEIAAANGWPAVRYKSRHAGGFDTETPSLLMVYVPGNKLQPPLPYDRWLNFALPADEGFEALIPTPQAAIPSTDDYAAERAGGTSLPRTFTMVSLTRAAGTAPGEIYFQKFYRSQLGSPVFTPEETSNLKTCIGCHPNGLRAIAPLGYHTSDGEEQLGLRETKAVAEINKAMIDAAGNKPVNWREVNVGGVTKKLLKPEAYGPFVGPITPLNLTTRSREFIMGGRLPDGRLAAGCYKNRSTVNVRDIFGRAPGANNVYSLSRSPSIRWEKVRDSMRCSGCHNNQLRGAINTLTNWNQVDFKILVDRSMPLGAHGNPLEEGDAAQRDNLSLDERIALANCLKAEFESEQRDLAAWLSQPVCR